MTQLAFLGGVESLLLEEFRGLAQARVDAVNPQVIPAVQQTQQLRSKAGQVAVRTG